MVRKQTARESGYRRLNMFIFRDPLLPSPIGFDPITWSSSLVTDSALTPYLCLHLTPLQSFPSVPLSSFIAWFAFVWPTSVSLDVFFCFLFFSGLWDFVFLYFSFFLFRFFFKSLLLFFLVCEILCFYHLSFVFFLSLLSYHLVFNYSPFFLSNLSLSSFSPLLYRRLPLKFNCSFPLYTSPAGS